MSGFDDIREHMEVIGADGVHIGTVDKVEDNRIKLTRPTVGWGTNSTTITSPRASSPRSRASRCG